MLILQVHTFTEGRTQNRDYCHDIKAGDTAILIFDDCTNQYYRYGYKYLDAAEQAKFNLEQCKDPDDYEQHLKEYYTQSIDNVAISSLTLSEFD